MLFEITRTSAWHHPTTPPCEGAKEITLQGRRGPEKRWGLRLRSIPDLMRLFAAEGEIIICSSTVDDKTPCIEIYDDYRE